MSLERGYIYNIAYTNYKEDPAPLVLVLYSGEKYTHALNLRYLSPSLTEEIIQFTSKIATGRLSARDARRLYHGYIKRRLPGVVRIAYRTYFTKKIKRPRVVSRGFFEVKNFLGTLKKTYTKDEYNKVRGKIRKSLKDAQDPEKQKKAVKKYLRLYHPDEKLTGKEAERRVRAYMDKIQAVLIKRDIDQSKHTWLKKRQRRIKFKRRPRPNLPRKKPHQRKKQ